MLREVVSMQHVHVTATAAVGGGQGVVAPATGAPVIEHALLAALQQLLLGLLVPLEDGLRLCGQDAGPHLTADSIAWSR